MQISVYGIKNCVTILNMSRILFLIAAVLLSSSCTSIREGNGVNTKEKLQPLQFSEPQAGKSVNASFNVQLKSNIPSDCLSLSLPRSYIAPNHPSGLTLIISRHLLNELVHLGESEPNNWTFDTRNDQLGKRAKSLLKNLSFFKDRYGCSSISIEKNLPFESEYLLGHLLGAGQITITETKTGKVLPMIEVLYVAHAGIDGWVYYMLPKEEGGNHFLSYQTWIR